MRNQSELAQLISILNKTGIKGNNEARFLKFAYDHIREIISVNWLLNSCILAVEIISACAPVKEGCFKHGGSNEYLLHSDKSKHTGESFHSGKNIDWSNFEAYLKE